MFRGGLKFFTALAGTVLIGAALVACSSKPDVPPAEAGVPELPPLYQIGAGDGLTIFVWRNAELTTSVTVRPDGRISVPLIEDLYVEGKNPSELSREIESKLGVYIQDPLVTVMVGGFVGTFPQQVRVVGEAATPQAILYRANMTVLDVVIATGGLTEFADGNNTTLVRAQGDQLAEYRVRLDDLLEDGDISANVALLPGDILIIPETFF
ncbi:XrtA/PEP-CTERM system exopolysaccharide export protein [Pelagibius marinus]|uniref:XrtA/PEP-CTERM system exopolysaccharide export protein n=1 Tax=Pelagibius marinus TaxID=2762760 RepID=UPI00187263F0|nr:XrtA/PEP-CTERM system exopolysaccharide export protein [Pelagibius marinus]